MSFEIWREFVENSNRKVGKKNGHEAMPTSRRRPRREFENDDHLTEPERRTRCQNKSESATQMNSQRTTRDLINGYANISDLVNRMMNRRKSELLLKYLESSPELDEKISQQNVKLIHENPNRPENPTSKSKNLFEKEKDPTKTKFRVRLRKKTPKKPDSSRQRRRLVVVSKPLRTSLPNEIFPRKMTPEIVPSSPLVVVSRSRIREDPIIIIKGRESSLIGTSESQLSTDPKITDLFQYSRLSSRSTSHQFFRNALPSSHRNRPPKELYQIQQTLSSSPLINRHPEHGRKLTTSSMPKISTECHQKSRLKVKNKENNTLPPLENEPVMKIIIKKKIK
ncbi:unnamed protein product [Oikopleura dioica]|uniref:Uncharacterized protein n=1 Tax=Oikopleura dioica TaxID=34765 RepID=E4XZI1_OIKDI|nr:unnamed protein product [Oikopleura dioica]